LFNKKFLIPIVIVTVFFGAFAWIGFHIYRDYGTYVDEFPQIEIGRINYEYLKTGDASKLDFHDWDHGAVFEVFTVLTTRFLPQNWHYEDQFYLRHLDVFLSFWAGGLALFALVTKKFRDWKMGLLGSAMLFLSPVLFGNAFFNSKDIPFLSLYIIGLLTLLLFLERPNLWTAGLHALICGLLIDIRVPGVILVAITIGMLAMELSASNRHSLHPSPRSTLIAGVGFVLATLLFIVVFFPAIWSNPVARFIEAYVSMSHRSWLCCCNLVLGQCFASGQIPWYYVPVWIAVSTPLWYVLLFLAGLAPAGIVLLSKPRLEITPEKRYMILTLSAFILPLAAIIIGKAVIYNGWRHMYFIYGPFLLIALEGFAFLGNQLAKKLSRPATWGALAIVTLISFSSTAAYILRNHPYEFVYFNVLAGTDMREIKERYELDYWGLSYIDGLRYILAHDSRPVIRVVANKNHLKEYTFMLSQAEQDRLLMASDMDSADYFMTDYYLHPQDYDLPNQIYAISVENAKILSVFKLK
jgi:hypothetical protein